MNQTSSSKLQCRTLRGPAKRLKSLFIIDNYKQYPCLWNTKLDTYKNRLLKDDAYQKIGQKLPKFSIVNGNFMTASAALKNLPCISVIGNVHAHPLQWAELCVNYEELCR